MGVSSAKGKAGQKKQAQKHKNTFAFVPNKFSPVALKIAATPIKGLCDHCTEILEWKKKIGKYKPLSQPKKCIHCTLKKVTNSYHVVCNECSVARKICAKCLTDYESTEVPESTLKEEESKERELLRSMNERQRRSYLRKQSRGDTEGCQKIANAIANQDEFDFGFSDDEGDFDDDQDGDEEQLEDELDKFEE